MSVAFEFSNKPRKYTAMRFIFSSLALILFVLAGSSGAGAAADAATSISAARAARIEEMLTLNGVKPDLLQMNAEAQKGLKAYARREAAILPQVAASDEARKKQLTEAYIAQMDSYAPKITWDALKPSLVKFCADNYTDAQIEDIIAFYKTPAGKVMREKSSALDQAVKIAVQSLQQSIVPQTLEATEDLKKKVGALPARVPAQSKAQPTPQ